MLTQDTIRDGLRAGEFFLEYMPTVWLADGRCVGAESLARWRRPTGLVPPGDFIPVIEKTPLSGLFTYWVMETIAAEVGDWLRLHPEVHIGLNVPPEILGRGGLVYAAEKTGIWSIRSQLILEVTERGLPDELALAALEEATRMGVRVALDDVGLTGVNLAVFSRCPVNVIKLDRSLVSGITPAGHPEWLAGLTGLVRSTGVAVIAEGVETQDQIDALRDAGIQMAQGYFFSQPLSARALMDYLTEAGRTASKP
jgi:EAL domain-containing protein (putative c-di-GMP-specific phosphodiesterase class I)